MSRDPSQNPSEPVPEDLVEQAKSARRRPEHVELAALVRDSLVDEGDPVAAHQLTFEHESVRLEVGVNVEAAQTNLSVRLFPAIDGRLELLAESAGLAFVPLVEAGSFTFGPVGHGLYRITFEPTGGGRPVWTDWFRI